jgi:hypothetical protein
MITFLFIVGCIVVIYAGIWLYLLKGCRDADSESFHQFHAAWLDSSYSVASWPELDGQRLRFKVGNNYKYLMINDNGELMCKIKWEYDAYSHDATGKPSRRLRNLMECFTKQISTMHKLEYNL